MSTLRKTRRAVAARLHCARCDGREAIVEPGGRFAEARPCPTCVQPCTKCDRGWILVDDADGLPFASRCDCARRTERIALFNAAHIPRNFADARVETFEERANASLTAAKKRMMSLYNGFAPGARGIGLSGPVGTGKTHLLTAFVADLTLERGIEARYVEFTHLLRDIKARFDRGAGESELMDELARIPVLVIDELGKGLSTDWQMSILDEIISKRYDGTVTTCFATNFPLDAPERRPSSKSRELFEVTTLDEKVGARIGSRLRAMCEVHRIEANDFRRERAETA